MLLYLRVSCSPKFLDFGGLFYVQYLISTEKYGALSVIYGKFLIYLIGLCRILVFVAPSYMAGFL